MTAAERHREAERRERDQRILLREQQREDDFKAMKSKFFGLVITDNEISVKVLESIEEYFEEGRTQNICVYSGQDTIQKPKPLYCLRRLATKS